MKQVIISNNVEVVEFEQAKELLANYDQGFHLNHLMEFKFSPDQIDVTI
jgi:hypothetical protein